MINQILKKLELKISEIETQINENQSIDIESKYYELKDTLQQNEEIIEVSLNPHMTESEWEQSEGIKSSLKELKIRIYKIGAHAGIVQSDDLFVCNIDGQLYSINHLNILEFRPN